MICLLIFPILKTRQKMWFLITIVAGLFLAARGLSPSLPADWQATTITPGAQKDCTYEVEADKRLRVDIDEAVPHVQALYSDRENIEWVLVKREAGIPRWKVWGGYGQDQYGGEMLYIGKTKPLENFSFPNEDAASKKVFIGRGHCSGTPASNCNDPLTRDIIFVVTKEGAGQHEHPAENEPGYWWIFNVYLNKALFGTDPPSNQGIPQWIKNCQGWLDGRGERVQGINSFSLTDQGLGLVGTPGPRPSFINPYSDILPRPAVADELKENYFFDREMAVLPTTEWALKLGTYRSSGMEVWLTQDGEGNLILDPKDGRNLYGLYLPMAPLDSTTGRTLQLGTFRPVRKFVYEWWTPACKPALYLYPAKPTELSVRVLPRGRITQSIPEHKNGWRVLAFPGGTIKEIGGQLYPYLYYEAEIEKVKVPQEGFMVRKDDLTNFFDQVLPILGLNLKESTDFKEYWLPKLSEEEKWFVGLVPEEEVNQVEPVEFSVKPDNFLRIRFYFEALDNQPALQDSGIIKYSQGINLNFFFNWLGIWSFKTPQRNGFTVVDWGGILAKGSCGLNEVSQ